MVAVNHSGIMHDAWENKRNLIIIAEDSEAVTFVNVIGQLRARAEIYIHNSELL